MRLFGKHVGEHAVAVAGAPSDLDIAASRAGNRIYLHVACARYEGSGPATFEAGARRSPPAAWSRSPRPTSDRQ